MIVGIVPSIVCRYPPDWFALRKWASALHCASIVDSLKIGYEKWGDQHKRRAVQCSKPAKQIFLFLVGFCFVNYHLTK